MTRTLLASLGLTLLAGCADDMADASTQADDLSAALALLDEPWCEPFANKVCAAAERCGCTAVGGWPEHCRAAAVGQCQRDLRATAESLTDGFLVSRDGAPRCLELLDEAFARCAAADKAQFASECRLVVPRAGEGLPRSGEACSGGQCARGLRCGFDSVCHVPHPLGERCQNDSDCAVPFVCRQDCRTDPTCQFHCVEPPVPEVGASCSEETGLFCPEGAVCLLSPRRECREPTDSRCLGDLECPLGQICGGFDFQTCTALPSEGEFCGDRFQCREGFACDVNSRLCVKAPGLNQVCSGIEFGLTQCDTGLVCRDGLCKHPGQAGDSCLFGSFTCADGLGCTFDDTTGQPVCEAQHLIDEGCQSDEICTPDAFCNFNVLTCQPRRQPGESCADGTRCIDGFDCVDTDPGDFRCAAVDGVGDVCNFSCPRGLRCERLFTRSTCVPLMCTAMKL